MAAAERAVFPVAESPAAGGLELRCVIFARAGDRLVLVRQRKDPVFGDSWILPGGTLLYGIHPRRAATHLLKDQVGVLPHWIRFFGIRSSVAADWILTFQFEAEIGDPDQSVEHDREVRLTSLETGLPSDLHPLAKPDLEMYHVLRLARGASTN